MCLSVNRGGQLTDCVHFVSGSPSCGSRVIRATLVMWEGDQSWRIPEATPIRVPVIWTGMFCIDLWQRNRAPPLSQVAQNLPHLPPPSSYCPQFGGSLEILRSLKTVCLPIQAGRAFRAIWSTTEDPGTMSPLNIVWLLGLDEVGSYPVG